MVLSLAGCWGMRGVVQSWSRGDVETRRSGLKLRARQGRSSAVVQGGHGGRPSQSARSASLSQPRSVDPRKYLVESYQPPSDRLLHKQEEPPSVHEPRTRNLLAYNISRSSRVG